MKTIIRPLSETDAKVSFKWRNDPEIWKYTGKSPDHKITYEDELQWLKDVLNRENEKRFAIIADGAYVGNVQLTDINGLEAHYHIFIGEKKYWGKGIAYEATRLIISFAFEELGLPTVILKVRIEHERAINLYKKIGFNEVYRDDEFLTMQIKKM